MLPMSARSGFKKMQNTINNPFRSPGHIRRVSSDDKARTRAYLIAAIRASWKHVVRVAGKPFVTPKTSLQAMNRLGIKYSEDGTVLTNCTAVAMAFRSKDLGLLSDAAPKRAYYLPSIEFSEDEKLAFLALSPFDQAAEITKRHHELLSEELQPVEALIIELPPKPNLDGLIVV